jgi:hypothetical protein
MMPCPYCGKSCGTVEVECEDKYGKIIRHLHYCPSCNALEIAPGDDTSELTPREIEKGWELLTSDSVADF